MTNWSRWVAGALALAGLLVFVPHAQAGVSFDNSVIRIGLDETGVLGLKPTDHANNCVYGDTDFTSMQRVDDDTDAEDCDREGEGWGLAYGAGDDTDTWGKAFYQYGTLQSGGDVTPGSFSYTATTAKSVVMVGTDIELTQDWKPAPKTQYLYGDHITIKNKGMNTIPSVRFRRVMTWSDSSTHYDQTCAEIGYTPWSGPPAPDSLVFLNLIRLSTDPSPLMPVVTYGSPVEGPPVQDSATNCDDQATEWEFQFTGLTPRDTREFTLWYGGAPSRDDSLAALKTVKAQLMSIDHTLANGAEGDGTEWNWIMAFGDIPPAAGNHTRITGSTAPHTPKPQPDYTPDNGTFTQVGSHPFNEPPQFKAIPHVTTEVNHAVHFVATAGDKEGDTLHYNYLDVPKGAYVEPGPDGVAFDWVPGSGDVGVHCGIRFLVTEYLVDARNVADPATRNAYPQSSTADTCIVVFDRNADNDYDGVRDVGDDCPGVADHLQADGDSDGIGNLCDNCPDTYNPDQADLDGDNIGDACAAKSANPVPANASLGRPGDLDGDGVPDAQDDCPTLADAHQSDLDHDGAGDLCDADADGDGALNFASDRTTILDNCPDVANPDQADANADHRGDACPQGQTHAVKGMPLAAPTAPASSMPPASAAAVPRAPAPHPAPAVPVLAAVVALAAAVLAARRKSA